jgi:hypothetical protein
MSPVFKSGAFIQQCFSVHPLCLNIKKVMLPERVVLSCSSCNLAHRLTVRSFTVLLSEASTPSLSKEGEAIPAVTHLAACAAQHPQALTVCAMDVLQDAVGFRCRECRRAFGLDIAVFETHQR